MAIDFTKGLGMMIIHAVSSAPTADAVYFLVNAYIESLSHFERCCAVPALALELPINGPLDLHRRLHALEHSARGRVASAAVTELGDVMRAALIRLEATGNADPAELRTASMSYARNDSPRSSRSV
jgi:hypothetical protein